MVGPNGIEIELKGMIDKIRQAFPEDKIFTERCIQDCPDEMWYIEETDTKALREQPDTFTEETSYSIFFSPNIKDVGKLQSRLREVRRWQQINLMWMPFVRDFMFEQNGDTLHTTFSLWRRYRLIPPDEAKMQTVEGCISIGKKNKLKQGE